MFKSKRVIDVYDWDNLVTETYGKPYSFQQQDDCKDRGIENFSCPCEPEDYENDTVPEIVNHGDMGVSFKAWLERDPNQKLSNPEDQNSWSLGLWWNRNFYPHVSMIINDLHEKGILEEGDFSIEIDW